MAKTIPIPLVVPVGSRDGTFATKDSFILNGIAEQTPGKKLRARKRPGTQLNTALGAGTAQGFFNYAGVYYAVINDVLFRTSGGTNAGSSGASFTQAQTPPWYARLNCSACVFKDRIWMIGGVTAGIAYADVSSSANGVNWSINAAGAPFGNRQNFGLIAFNGKMFVIGGFVTATTTYANDVWSTTDGTNWVQETNSAPWAGRGYFGCVTDNTGIYILGGDNGTANSFNDIWFSADGATWTQVAVQSAVWSKRSLFGCAYFQGQLVVAGGLERVGGVTAQKNDVWTSSNGGGTWVLATAAAFASARQSFPLLVYQNKLWALGGFAGAYLADVYSSTNGAFWTLVGSTPGWAARGLGAGVVFRSPSSVNQYRFDTLWMLAGAGNVLVNGTQEVWYGNIDTGFTSSYPLFPPITGQPYQFGTFMNGTKLVIKNQCAAWVLEAGTLNRITDPNYPSTTVPGLAVLGVFVHVCTPEGELHSSASDNPYVWPALNFTTADYEDDYAVAIGKYANYVMVLGQFTTQFFYDNGANQPTGSPLAPNQNANIRIGCANAATVVNLGVTMMFLGITEKGETQVMMMQGTTPTPVSTPEIDEVIAVGGSRLALAASVNGRLLYVFNTGGGNCVVYDVEKKWWYLWTSFPYYAFATDFTPGAFLLLHQTNGNIYNLGFAYGVDDGSTFTWGVQTDNVDFENDEMRKFFGRLTLVGDRAPGTVNILVSDNDYQTFNSLGSVDMSLARAYLTRCGSAYRRAFLLLQQDSNIDCRWERLDMRVDVQQEEE